MLKGNNKLNKINMKKIFTFIIVVVSMFISISANAQLRTQTHEEVAGYKEVFS